MGNRKRLFPVAMFLSAVSELAGLVPYILIWLIMRELLTDTPVHSNNSVAAYALWTGITAVGSVALYFASLACSHLVAFRVETNIRKEAMAKVVAMPLGFFDTTTSGRIRKVIDDNAGVTHSFVAHQLPDLAGTVLVPVASIALIMFFNARLGLACLIPVAIAMAIMGHTMNTRGREFMAAYMNLLEKMNTEAVEYVRGIPVVKVFQQTVYSFKNFYNVIMEYRQTASRYTGLWQLPMSLYTVVINSFVFTLIPVTILLTTSGDSSAGVMLDMLLFVLITPVFSQCIMRSMYIGQAVGQASEAIDRLDSLLSFSPLPQNPSPKRPTTFDVRFDNVTFRYPGMTRNAVSSVSFCIPTGKRVVLVGASGSGKTTLARLVPRFWEASSGSVSIGGINVNDIAADELMRNVSFVFQNSRLFKATILDNIRYGRPDATIDEVNRAIRLAQCSEIIDRLPMGLNTRIGADGTYLSGGEQQRVVLARAFLKDAPIIVLDEATAFADPENEHMIQSALRLLTRGKTVLTIAHRLNSVTDADEIIVMEGGRVVERGRHAALVAAGGLYSRMWNEYCKSVKWTLNKKDNDND